MNAQPESPATLNSERLRDGLLCFTEPSRHRLMRILHAPALKGSIPSGDVEILADSENQTIDALMLELLPVAQLYAHAPMSGFRVGAVLRGTSGSFYCGANLEVPGLELGCSVHAEQAAVANAFMQGETGAVSIAVSAAPCGHCRQFLNELASASDLKILVRASGAIRLSSLLPDAFGPGELGNNERVFRSRSPDLHLVSVAPDQLTSAGLEAARHSYAPYTQAYSGIALRTMAGNMYQGSYIENAAFNPSLPPLQVALVQLVMSAGSLANISEAVLVELEKAPITQATSTREILRALAPAATLRTALAKIPL